MRLSGLGITEPQSDAQAGVRLHREWSKWLLGETGIDVDFRVRFSLALAFTEADVRRLHAAIPWQQRQSGYAVRWLESADARHVEPRISDETLGATLAEGGGGVEPCRLVLAPTRAAERLGVTVRQGRAIGLQRVGGRITGVVREREVLSCATALLALGLWSAEASDWSACRSRFGRSRARSSGGRLRVRRSDVPSAGRSRRATRSAPRL